VSHLRDQAGRKRRTPRRAHPSDRFTKRELWTQLEELKDRIGLAAAKAEDLRRDACQHRAPRGATEWQAGEIRDILRAGRRPEPDTADQTAGVVSAKPVRPGDFVSWAHGRARRTGEVVEIYGGKADIRFPRGKGCSIDLSRLTVVARSRDGDEVGDAGPRCSQGRLPAMINTDILTPCESCGRLLCGSCFAAGQGLCNECYSDGEPSVPRDENEAGDERRRTGGQR
jgi:hypothetical protein